MNVDQKEENGLKMLQDILFKRMFQYEREQKNEKIQLRRNCYSSFGAVCINVDEWLTRVACIKERICLILQLCYRKIR